MVQIADRTGRAAYPAGVSESDMVGTLVGNRIPKDYFITQGSGESDITVHAGSYHLALRQAGIEMCNIITYSSILPGIATEVPRPDHLTHGAVMETIMAVANTAKGERATAGVGYGWLMEKETGRKYGGLVCEHNGNYSAEAIEKMLRASLEELYCNGFANAYELQDVQVLTETIVPQKQFGTAVVALCFLNYIYPVLARPE